MLRTVIWFARFWLFLIVKTPQMYFAKKLDRDGRLSERDAYVAKVTKQWAQMLTRSAGAKIEVHGNEQVPTDGPLVFIANHQGNFDIPIMIGHVARHKALISKVEVKLMPWIRTWMRLMQCVFMDRRDLRQSAKAILDAIEIVKKGQPMVIFPEGTRSKSDALGDFKHGSFRLALKSGAPIVPVTIDGSWRIHEQQGYIKPATVHVTVHPPIPTAGLSKEDADALPGKVKAIIASSLTKIKQQLGSD